MAKKAVKKLKWTDIGDLAFRLIDEHPKTDPSKLSAASISDYVCALPDFGDKAKKPGLTLLEEIQSRWAEERDDMVDELGPLAEDAGELDEDAYHNDRMVDEMDHDDDDDDEDEDEFEALDDEFSDEDED